MPIHRDNKGFLFSPDASGAPSLGLESCQLEACVEEILDRNLQGAFGRHPEFTELDLDVLNRLPHLRVLALWDIKLKDVSAVYDLVSLDHFRISGKRPAIDFTRMTNIGSLVLEHHRHDVGLEELANLQMMHLWRYKAPAKESFQMPLSPSLEELGIFWSNVENLDGFGCFPKLKKLEVARCRNLKSLGNLAKTMPKLEHLVVDACGRLTAEAARKALSDHRNIRHAFTGKELIVTSRR